MNGKIGVMKIWLKATGLALIMAVLMLLLTFGAIFIFAWHKLSIISSSAGMTNQDLIQRVWAGWSDNQYTVSQQLTFLILGTDIDPQRETQAVLTDTILLVNLTPSTGAVNLLAIPRDLWSEKYQTKINALYSYGNDFNPGEPEKFVADTLADLLAISIDETLVVSLDQLQTLIDQIGGIDIDVPETFIDTMYPSESPLDKESPVQTVEFNAGPQIMNGSDAIKYIRSRKSESAAGSDNDRVIRQQLVIQAITNKLASKQVIVNSSVMGRLLNLYMTQFDTQLPIEKLVGIGKSIWSGQRQLTIHPHSLSITSGDEIGVIHHPAIWKYNGQWVYEIEDQANLQSEVKIKLGLRESDE